MSTHLHETLYNQAYKLCKKLKLMPFQPGSMIVLAYIEHDRQAHDINVCFHELGHLYSLEQLEFNSVINRKIIPEDCANNIGAYIQYNMNDEQRYASELSARAIQIGLNIIYNLWPGYPELARATSEYPEPIVRGAVADPKTADAVIQIMNDLAVKGY